MRRPRDPVVYFVDRSLGSGVVPDVLRKAGASVLKHDDRFPTDCKDEVWLAEAGRKGWVVLTKDKRIMRRAIERAALEEHGVAAFVLTSGDIRGEEAARVLSSALPRMVRILEKCDRPLLATVSRTGYVTVVHGRRRGGMRR